MKDVDNHYEDALSYTLSTLIKKGNKMKYKVGDIVECVDEERELFGCKVGHFYTIKKVESESGDVMLDNLQWWNTYNYQMTSNQLRNHL